MQPLTPDQAALLQAANIEVDFGAVVLNPDLTVNTDVGDNGDISADLRGGTTSWSLHATIHNSCTLQLSVELTWGIDLVQLYQTIRDSDGHEATWPVGVFALTTPERTVGEDPTVYEVQGYDRLMLLDRQVGEDYTVFKGTTYRDALLNVFADAGLAGVIIEGSAADDTLPVDRTWPLVANSAYDPDQDDTPATWLRVVNDLLRQINFRGIWADEEGRFRCQPYQSPAARGPDYTFDADDRLTIVGQDRTLVQDVWATPNKWVFRQANRPDDAPEAEEGDGIYTVTNQSFGPTSIDRRGLTWVSVVDYEAASQAKLVELGNRHVAQDLRVTTRLRATTGPFPPAGHADVYTYTDTSLGGTRKVQAVTREVPLDGGDVQWEWEVVVDTDGFDTGIPPFLSS